MRRLPVGLAALLAAGTPVATAVATEGLRDDERVRFHDGLAHPTADGRWRFCVDAWVFEVERRPGAAALLAAALGVDRDALSSDDRARFDTRSRLFLTDDERGKRLVVRVQGVSDALPLPASDAEGRIRHCVDLATAPPPGRWWRFERIADDAIRRAAPEVPPLRALVLPAEGLSVVSDIDDTIKDTRVLDRHAMLMNTFVRPFKPVGGMAAAYRAIDARTDASGGENGTRFHYLSGSPHPLYPVLAGFLRDAAFPEGSLHLREVEVLEDLFGETGTFSHKRAVLDALLAAAPARRFVLVGDSGERDPEIYGATARAWPGRVAAIRIRDVTGESRDAARYAEAFRDLPAGLWGVFRDAEALQADAGWRVAVGALDAR
ncbi:phosphatase domain-containing protein [Silanimonas sp.]|uniref:phosphatidate phosphatase App1 family protein n=1 Tax=Silanimonas sp. TaxID=1929290 RepID=UPI0022BCDBF4|nr:phosphatase domain-containing protein [Silanimonas sp.]MCZ8164454.1 DUF2183 domain-containing protein [Silanimonas sp.]